MLPGLGGGLNGSQSRSLITELQRGTVWSSTSTLSTYTTSAFSIGAASATRRVIALITAEWSSSGSYSLSTVTIGGVSATIIQVARDSSSGFVRDIAAIAYAIVPTGTTAAVVATFSTAADGCTINTVAIDNESTGLISSNTFSTNVFAPCTTSNEVLDNAFLVSVCGATSSVDTIAWTNATEWDETGASNVITFGSAIARPTVPAAAYSVTATPGSSVTGVMCTAVFF